MAKVDLKKEAKTANKVSKNKDVITDDDLIGCCPSSVLKKLKAAKTMAQRADLLFTLEKNELKALRDAFNEMDKFCSKLEAWFIQEIPEDQTGVSGKQGRVEVKEKEIATVEDWDAFYAHIKKKGEFELLNRAINQKSIAERWEAGKVVAGVGKFTKKVLSLTGVKK